ncbi:uncharacterized protein LOC126904540 isoform X4 [Daktulosphaira vitifoliae]|uniref:uncharacterized protein LOC126904540 isoform X3 n=1 Tax=Daktulosphaira vitifoliae TaxID=58002 RepID=UPI0021A9EC2F|nr:uncharacterized protein LOC126904540 isoform X3 [Daktulosphaira vitifoliae]XP_050539600.1 uncharacterized protein LOC126904540 isoform X4 [Daktulosphaira vitifoliae]
MNTLIKLFLLFCIFYYTKSIVIESVVKFIKNVESQDGEFKFNIGDLKIPYYFNPVDDEWKREKCSSLGFTYKEPVTHQLLTINVVPVDILNNRHYLFRTLSNIICGDSNLHSKLKKQVSLSLIENPIMEEMFGTKENFSDYLSKFVLIKDSDTTMDEGAVKQCPICYEDSTSTLWDCKHRLCHNCSEMMLQRKQMKCPLCRENISYITDKETAQPVNFCRRSPIVLTLNNTNMSK